MLSGMTIHLEIIIQDYINNESESEHHSVVSDSL